MSTTDTLPTTYRGYTIREETDPWRRQRGELFVFFKDNEEKCFYEMNVTDAKLTIDDMEVEKETPEPPSSPLSISGDTHKLEALMFAVHDYVRKIRAICFENPGLGNDLKLTKSIMEEWQGIIAQQIKDQIFDEETKD